MRWNWIWAIMSIAGLNSCTENIVYRQYNGTTNNAIYILSSNQSAPLLLVNGPDALTPCGHTNDGHIIYTRMTSTGGNIYSVNYDGTGVSKVFDTISDDQCVYVTPKNTIIYSETVPAWNGRHNLMAIQVGSVIPQPIATDPEDQFFVAFAPDERVIYLRQTSLPAYAYEILSSKIGGTPTMLAQVFPPDYRPPQFNVVTQDNKVIFSEVTEYQQNRLSQNIFSVNTDGGNPFALAQNPPAEEIFCALTNDNRILYTERSQGVVDGVEEYFGDIYIVNTDGSQRTLLNPGPPDYNNLCVGVTPDNHVIFIRTDSSARNEGIGDIYSIYADGNSPSVLLSPNIPNTTNTFEKSTSSNRILFRSATATETPKGTVYNVTLNSINPDGSGFVSLASNYNLVQGVTSSGKVIYNTQVQSTNPFITMNLFSVPANGTNPPTAFSPTTDTQDLSFIFNN